MQDFTRRTLLQGAYRADRGRHPDFYGPALLNFAKAWAQTAPWKPKQGAKLTLMRWEALRAGRG